MTNDQIANDGDYATLVRALRSAISTGSGAATRPGQLRSRIEDALGAEQTQRFRREVHQLVAAAEEHLPVNLTRFGPIAADNVERLAIELAYARGWTPEVGRRTARTWAAALGFEQFAADSEPPAPPPAQIPPPAQAPPPAQTALPAPPAPATPAFTPQAPGAPVFTPQAPPSPLTPQAPAPPVEPVRYDQPWAPMPAAQWPRSNKRLRRLAIAQNGEEPLAVTLAYAGIPLLIVVILTVVITIALVVMTFVVHPGVIRFVLYIAGVAWVQFLIFMLRRGLLIATPAGVQFTPYDLTVRRPQLHKSVFVPWGHIAVSPGFVAKLGLSEHQIQVGPRNQAFVRAVAATQGAGRP